MGIFGSDKKSGRKHSVDYQALPQGPPRRYLCSAVYVAGARRNFMIREITSGLSGIDLRRYAQSLFLDDIYEVSCGNRNGDDGKNHRVMITGSLEDVSVDSLGKN